TIIQPIPQPATTQEGWAHETSFPGCAATADRHRASISGPQCFSRTATAGLSGQILAPAAGNLGRLTAARNPGVGGRFETFASARLVERRVGANRLPVFRRREPARRARFFGVASGQPDRTGR